MARRGDCGCEAECRRDASGLRFRSRNRSGGDKVKVTSLARGTEDAHFVDARPNHIVTFETRADVLLQGGARAGNWMAPTAAQTPRANGKILTGGPRATW